MKDRPIIFSGEMVRAILSGHKTQTRRIIKPQPVGCDEDGPFVQIKRSSKMLEGVLVFADRKHLNCPYGQPGDQLWVRETWAAIWPDVYPVPLEECKIEYKANTNNPYPGDWPEEEARGNDEAPKWKPSIHMPRWASRLTLEIVNIQVERLQDITPIDAIKEGIPNGAYAHGHEIDSFKRLWDRINMKNGIPWENNPWVWVIEFRKLETINNA